MWRRALYETFLVFHYSFLNQGQRPPNPPGGLYTFLGYSLSWGMTYLLISMTTKTKQILQKKTCNGAAPHWANITGAITYCIFGVSKPQKPFISGVWHHCSACFYPTISLVFIALPTTECIKFVGEEGNNIFFI